MAPGQTELIGMLLSAEEHAQSVSVQNPQAAVTTTSSVSRVLARIEFGWGYTFYIRQDLQGTFHTYPNVGGPYRSLQEADKAIDRYLDELRDPKMSRQPDDTSAWDSMIRKGLYWPDGTSQHSISRAQEKTHDQMRHMVQALLVDKYNEDLHLCGDLAYELKDVLNFNSFFEHSSLYYHLNFCTNSKAADYSDSDTNNMFFAEVKLVKQGAQIEVVVCCFCAVDTIDKGQPCKACNNAEKFDVKHPDSSVELAAGHLYPCTQFCGGAYMVDMDYHNSEDEDTYLRNKEAAELRHMYKGLDDPRIIENIFTLPPYVTTVED